MLCPFRCKVVEKKLRWSDPHILLDGKVTSCASLHSLYVGPPYRPFIVLGEYVGCVCLIAAMPGWAS